MKIVSFESLSSPIGVEKKSFEEFSPIDWFHYYWDRSDKIDIEIKTKQKDAEDVFLIFESKIMPLEKQKTICAGDLIKHLIGFLPRKSLSYSHQAKLLSLIHEMIDELSKDLFVDITLIKELKKSILSQLQPKLKNEILYSEAKKIAQELWNAFKYNEISIEELMLLMQNEDELMAFINSVQERYIEEKNKTAKTQGNANQEHFYQKADVHEKANDPEESALENKDIKIFYKKLVLKLHPDREQDTELKVKKTELMRILTTAWGVKDIFTIISLAKQHIPETEFSLSDQSLVAINRTLQKKIKSKEVELNNIFTGELKGVVYEIFKKETNSRMMKEFENVSRTIDKEIRYTVHSQSALRTVGDIRDMLIAKEAEDERLALVRDMMEDEAFFRHMFR